MEGKTLIFLLVAYSVGIALSNPLVNPNYDNVPQCLQPPVSGMCLAYFPSFYYNPGKKTCDTFIYGGCQGNANRFFSFQECMDKCGGYTEEPSDFKLVLENGEDESPTESEPQVEDICSLSSEMGPCRAMMPRFYFNGDKCESFIYGGCEGNGNNFKSVEECQQRCGSTSSEEVAAVDSDDQNEKASDEAVAEEASDEGADKSDSKSEN